MIQNPQILPGTGRGTAEGGGGGYPHEARLRVDASPLRQPLRVCHLPVPGRIS